MKDVKMSSEFKTVEITNYEIDFQLLQNLSKQWTYSLNIFVKNKAEDSEDSLLIKNIKDNTVIDANCVILHGRSFYTQWEYAAESALDIIEMLGFEVEDQEHLFNVFFWDTETLTHVSKIGLFDGNDFKLK